MTIQAKFTVAEALKMGSVKAYAKALADTMKLLCGVNMRRVDVAIEKIGNNITVTVSS